MQDKISYLANGMAGGNYLPQSPQETWDYRYGDCKAKTYLLLAMLRDLGIDGEAALVRSNGGDAVAELLPMASSFDHVIVRARIAGRNYWLDGTSAGTRLANVDEVPVSFTRCRCAKAARSSSNWTNALNPCRTR